MAVLVWSLLGVAFLLGVFVRSGWRYVAVAGFPVALALYGLMWLTGGFDDDHEGTAWFLTLVYGVPIYTALWVALSAIGHGIRRVILKH